MTECRILESFVVVEQVAVYSQSFPLGVVSIRMFLFLLLRVIFQGSPRMGPMDQGSGVSGHPKL